MKIVVLGSGTSVPHAQRSSSGFWLETNGHTLLLDCSAHRRFIEWRRKISIGQISTPIWISHFHLDHVGGFAAFLFGTKYAPETQKRTKPLKIFGAKGLRKLLENFDKANDYGVFKQPFPLEIVEVEPLEKFDILPDVQAVALDTPHTDESLAIHLRDAEGKTLVYTSDTGFDLALGSFARNVDLLIIECSFVKEKPVETHLELAEAIRIFTPNGTQLIFKRKSLSFRRCVKFWKRKTVCIWRFKED
jgi:ribonuclease BN (tRNA processing enzyme)